ncbi:ABC transporter substrate-binding protein [Halorubrum sp. ASP1]|jgi:peptide/nickel transport system substrate-binding protein|uniref:ABC transporter substrate-binding protein n=1 Tax=Halorubrum tropicale TaxID=1765655 RepID=A0A0N0BRZ9_9EURY|nr:MULTISPECIES: ABC transporter substrate-binding protein [Halorubrum]KOX97504.1 ABC transporter substrate-binding protein [Halorubrum tropicale]RLM49261.1 ABC transporter substrate-binding protein [Halorubrum sp. Atlit-28R]TKX62716.1 ABC transporter substrate-binding protein [Halorubrum sp. ASP1]
MRRQHTQRISRRKVLAGGAAGTSLLLAGCAGGGDGGDGSDGGDGGDGSDGGDGGDGSDGGDGGSAPTLYFAQAKGPLDMDPVVMNDVPSAQIAGRIFDGLYEYGDGVSLEPKIAADMPTVERDGTRFIVPIREDAQFQNGDPVTAEDVVHTMMAPVEEQTENASEVDMIDTGEVVDETTAQFDLKYPYGAFTIAMARNVVNASVRQEDTEAYNMDPVTSGPFKLSEWEPESYATLERWDDYWDSDNLPEIGAVEFEPIVEQTTRVTELETGNVDIIESIPPQLYETVEANQSATLTEEPGIGYFYLAFNCGEGPTSDPLVREAVDYCVSMDQAVENFVEPAGVRQTSPFPSSISEEWDFPTDEWSDIQHDQDLEEAQALFEEAGVPMDYNWRIIVPPDDKREQIGISIGDGLQNAGFQNVEVQRLDWGTFLDAYVTGSEDDYNMYTLGWSGSPDPDTFAYNLLSQETEGVTNGTFHDYEEASQKLTQARESADREERRQLYIEATTSLLEGRVHLPAYNLNNSYGVRNVVEGFSSHPISTEIQLGGVTVTR